jgi:hypothetical protein
MLVKTLLEDGAPIEQLMISEFGKVDSLHLLIGGLTTLKHLSIVLDMPNDLDFSNFLNLRHLEVKYFDNSVPNFDQLSPVSSQLQSLSIVGSQTCSNALPIYQFESLDTFMLSCTSLILLAPLTFDCPVSLRSLFLYIPAPNNFSICSNISTLESLTLSSSSGIDFTVQDWPLALKHLTLISGIGEMVLPSTIETLSIVNPGFIGIPDISHCENLTSLSITFSLRTNSLNHIPDFSRTKLSYLEMINWYHDNTTLEQIICSIPVGRLETMIISDPMDDEILITLPACLLSFHQLHTISIYAMSISTESLEYLPTNLRSLSLLGITRIKTRTLNFVPDWNRLVTDLPLLEELNFESNHIISTFPSEFMRLGKLQTLNLKQNGFYGTIPEPFFAAIPTLQVLHLSNNLMSGTIPWYGLQNVTSLQLRNNSFSAWPSLYGSPTKLEEISVNLNKLQSFPNDASFASSHNLRIMDVGHNLNLGGPLPHVWGPSHPLISSIDLSSCAFSGTIPSPISASRLNIFTLANNQLCGPLPEVSSSKVQTKALNFFFNSLSGPIPSSWANYSIFSTMDLSRNLLNGVIPTHSFISQTGKRWLNILLLHHNDFTGRVFNMNDFKLLGILNLDYTSMEACTADPNFSATPPVVCSMIGTPQDVCECSSWYPCDERISHCAGTPSAVPTTSAPIHVPTFSSQCVLPPNRPMANPPLSCPQPIPNGFYCVNGQMVSFGTITAPIITFPPNSGVIQVNGSLNIDTITFNGIDSVLHVNGCVNVPGGIIIELNDDKNSEKTKQPITLIIQNEGCPSSLSDVKVTVKEVKSCKKTSVKTDTSTSSQLNVLFKIDSLACNTKWIILGSTLGAVLVILVVLILVFSLSESARAWVRPHSKRIVYYFNDNPNPKSVKDE